MCSTTLKARLHYQQKYQVCAHGKHTAYHAAPQRTRTAINHQGPVWAQACVADCEVLVRVGPQDHPCGRPHRQCHSAARHVHHPAIGGHTGDARDADAGLPHTLPALVRGDEVPVVGGGEH